MIKVNESDILHVFDIKPMGAPRMTKRDKWKKRPVVTRYHAFKDHLRLLANKACWKPGDRLNILFIVPMAESWSEKKKKEYFGSPHRQRPDVDNMVKAVLDTMNKEDSHVWNVHSRKIWGRVGKIVILKNEEL